MTDLIAGTLVGVRTWLVRENGSLGSLGQAWRWREGWNYGRCLSPLLHDHRAGSEGCVCGFYAHTDTGQAFYNKEAWQGTNTIHGIIEAKGLATVADWGFRAEQARIVALVLPTKPVRSRTHRALIRMDARMGFPLAVSGLVLSSASFSSVAFLATKSQDTGLLFGLLASVVLGMTAVMVALRAHLLASAARAYTKARLPLIQDKYPGVEWYPTMEEALAAHPLTTVTKRGKEV